MVLLPPALFKKGEEGRKKKEVLHLSRCYTHIRISLISLACLANFMGQLFGSGYIDYTNITCSVRGFAGPFAVKSESTVRIPRGPLFFPPSFPPAK